MTREELRVMMRAMTAQRRARARATNFAVISSPRSVVDRWAQRSRCTRSGELGEYSTYALLRLRRKAQRQKEGPALP